MFRPHRLTDARKTGTEETKRQFSFKACHCGKRLPAYCERVRAISLTMNVEFCAVARKGKLGELWEKVNSI